MMTFTRTVRGTEAADGTFGADTTSTITGDGMLVQGSPQEYEAAGLTRVVGVTVLFTPSAYPLSAYTDEFVQAGDKTEINGVTFTVKKVLSVVAPDGYVIVSRIALGV
jgi:hypothetical protein